MVEGGWGNPREEKLRLTVALVGLTMLPLEMVAEDKERFGSP